MLLVIFDIQLSSLFLLLLRSDLALQFLSQKLEGADLSTKFNRPITLSCTVLVHKNASNLWVEVSFDTFVFTSETFIYTDLSSSFEAKLLVSHFLLESLHLVIEVISLHFQSIPQYFELIKLCVLILDQFVLAFGTFL